MFCNVLIFIKKIKIAKIFYDKKDYLVLSTSPNVSLNFSLIFVMFSQNVIFFYKWLENILMKKQIKHNFVLTNLCYVTSLYFFYFNFFFLLSKNYVSYKYIKESFVYLNVTCKNFLYNKLFLNIQKTNYWLQSGTFSFFFLSVFLKFCLLKTFKKTFLFFKKYSFNSNVLFKKLRLWFFKKYQYVQSRIGRGFFLLEFFEIIFFFFFTKDCYFFGNWLKKILEQVFFKKHKLFFQFIFNFFLRWFFLFSKFFNFLGLYISLSGKISVSGNAKKRVQSFKIGSFGFTAVNFKLNLYKNYVWTPTGALGLTLVISYV